MKPLKKIIAYNTPRLALALKALFGPSCGVGSFHNREHSPDLKMGDRSIHSAEYFYKKYIDERGDRDKDPIRFLHIGAGGRERRKLKNAISNVISPDEYIVLDIEDRASDEEFTMLKADLCNCPEIPDDSIDFVCSHSVFEHLHNPWKACEEIGRILKPGGICFTETVFSWRHHPGSNSGSDYYRYTHSGLTHLMESHGELSTVDCFYDINKRRRNFAGGKHQGNRDGIKPDIYGGWLENWVIVHIGCKRKTDEKLV